MVRICAAGMDFLRGTTAPVPLRGTTMGISSGSGTTMEHSSPTIFLTAGLRGFFSFTTTGREATMLESKPAVSDILRK